MATGIYVFTWISVIALAFAADDTLLLCDRLCNDSSCMINSSGLVKNCCSSGNHQNFTMKFNGSDFESNLVLANLTFESCVRPIIIEHLGSVTITNVTFRYSRILLILMINRYHSPHSNYFAVMYVFYLCRNFTDTVLDIFNVGNVLVDNCTFENNFNNGSGSTPFRGNAGAIAIGFSNVSDADIDITEYTNIAITNSMFINNTANTSRTTDDVLMGKIFSGRGGAIALYITSPDNVNVSVQFTSKFNHFISNNATSAGGAIYAHLSGNYTNVTLHVEDCNFTGNDAPDGAGIEFTYDLGKSACVISSCDIDNVIDCSPTMSPTLSCPSYVPAKSIVKNCYFERNHGGFGGAFKGIQINPFGNNNFITFEDCTFVNNIADVGAAAYFQSRYSVADVRMNNSIRMENWYVACW